MGLTLVAAVCDRHRADRLCSTALTERRYRNKPSPAVQRDDGFQPADMNDSPIAGRGIL